MCKLLFKASKLGIEQSKYKVDLASQVNKFDEIEGLSNSQKESLEHLDLTGWGNEGNDGHMHKNLMIAYYIISTLVWVFYGYVSSTVLVSSVILISMHQISNLASIIGLWLLFGVVGAVTLGNVIEFNVGRDYNLQHWKKHLILDDILYIIIVAIGILGYVM